MDNHKKNQILKMLGECAAALSKNNMEAFVAKDKDEAKEIFKELLSDCDTVTMGGSMTIGECGLTDILKSGDYTFYDRNVPGLTPDEIGDIYRKAFSCDAYISSSNAITQNGELYNVDGNSNRVAAMLFGSKKLIVVAGYNKVVKDLNQAILRVKTHAAPANCIRLGIESYCSEKASCLSLTTPNPDMCSGCNSDSRICASYTVMARQRNKDRVKVILVAEELGY
ncbi:MAG: lactate utilization protein [Clostridia bacterium]|nr:lactate utilization protein [Clostridia bacterium]